MLPPHEQVSAVTGCRVLETIEHEGRHRRVQSLTCLLHVAGHACKGRLHLGMAIDADVTLNAPTCIIHASAAQCSLFITCNLGLLGLA